MTETQYAENELRLAGKALREIESAPLLDQQEARAAWSEALLDPSLIAERVGWLVNGSYGYGQMLLAKRAATARGNYVAGVAQLLAAFEWRCPCAFAVEAWLKLKPAQQKAVNSAIAAELKYEKFTHREFDLWP